MTSNNSNNGVNMRSDEKRDSYAKTFLYEHLPFNSMDRNLFDSITKTVIGTEELTKAVDYHWQNIEPSMADIYVRMKRMHLSTNFYRYSRIYDLCYVLGINNIYDASLATNFVYEFFGKFSFKQCGEIITNNIKIVNQKYGYHKKTNLPNI